MTARVRVPLAAVADLHEHPLSGQVPAMRPAEWAAFLADVARRGILEPLRLAADGSTVLDGRHRLRAAREVGLGQVPAMPALCDPGDEPSTCSGRRSTAATSATTNGRCWAPAWPRLWAGSGGGAS